MDEAVRRYLQEKYQEDLNQLNNAQAFANLGDVFAASKVGSQDKFYNSQREVAKDQTLGDIKRQDELDMKKLMLQQQLEKANADREMRGQIATLARERNAADKERVIGEKQEKDIQNLSKSISGAQDALNNIDKIEQSLGAPLESFTTQDGVLKKNGTEVDLPGVSMPFVGRVSAYSSKARDLAGDVSTVFNTVLKDRSGAAVTNSEMERLKTEFGQGKYNTEAELIGAMKDFKTALSKELKNREAGYKPELVREYTERGGRTSYSIPEQMGGSPSNEEAASIARRKRIEELRAKQGGR